jgi:hypothetical protein
MLWTRPNVRIARSLDRWQGLRVADPLIERDEVVALRFNVSDIAVALEKIRLLLGGDDGEEEADKG